MDAETWMLIVSWVVGGLAFLGCWPALMSPLVFMMERPTTRRSTRVLFACIVSFPIAALCGLFAGWALHRRGHDVWGLALACAPALIIAVALAALKRVNAALRGIGNAQASS